MNWNTVPQKVQKWIRQKYHWNNKFRGNRPNTPSPEFLRLEKSHEIKTNFDYFQYPGYKFLPVNPEIFLLADSTEMLLLHETRNAILGSDGYLHLQKKGYFLLADQR